MQPDDITQSEILRHEKDYMCSTEQANMKRIIDNLISDMCSGYNLTKSEALLSQEMMRIGYIAGLIISKEVL